jgi:threonine dehydratase
LISLRAGCVLGAPQPRNGHDTTPALTRRGLFVGEIRRPNDTMQTPIEQLRQAASLNAVLRPVTMVECPRLSKRLGANLVLASETFQHTGSFKFRAAYNVAASVKHELLIAASSGNFGQALAHACSLLGKSCIVVMPTTSAKVKVDCVREFGGQVEFVDVRVTSRAQRVEELASQHPEAYIASAYDDPLVIDGNASLGREISELNESLEQVVVPIGGGGLSAGIIKGIQESGRHIAVRGAEPLLGNDAARSLEAGEIIRNETEPQTIADGARTVSVGRHNWPILRDGLAGIVEVPEENIVEGVRLLFKLANLKAEPTGALGIGAVLTQPEVFRGQRICCVVSGGNVDPAVYANILFGHTERIKS